MRVLHVGKFYPPAVGGMESVVRDLCEGTADRWETHVAVGHHRPRTEREHRRGVEVIRVGTVGRVGSVALCPTLALELWRSHYDCVVLHEPNPPAALTLRLRVPGRRLVVWHHSDVVRPAWAPSVYTLVQRALYRRADCVVFSSPRLLVTSPVRHHARQTAVIPFGVDLDRFLHLDPAQRAAADRLRRDHRGPRILTVGRLVYYKGVDVLLRAMAHGPGTLTVIGDGPARPQLEDLATRLGLADRVGFVPHVPAEDLAAHYHAADVFVLPSVERTETFGIVQLEAMAAGLPVISTDLPTGVPWVNQDGVTGLVVPPAEVEPLAWALGRLAHNAALRHQLGQAGRRRVRAHFSRERMVGDFTALIESVVAGRVPAPLARPATEVPADGVLVGWGA